MAGVRSWQAHAPAILYLTAPYVVTNINVRQDLAEVVATAMIPPIVAATLSILRADRLHAGPAAALAASHRLLRRQPQPDAAVGDDDPDHQRRDRGHRRAAGARPRHPARRASRPGHRGPGDGGQRLVPAARPGLPRRHRHRSTASMNGRRLLRDAHPELAAQHLLGLRHRTGLPERSLSIALPVLAIAWVAVAALVSRASWRGVWARTLAVLMLADGRSAHRSWSIPVGSCRFLTRGP